MPKLSISVDKRLEMSRIERALADPARLARAIGWHSFGKWKHQLRSAREHYRELNKEYPVVRGLEANTTASRGRALLDYVVKPFLPGFDETKARTHANNWRSRAMVRILQDLGFSVDVTDWRFRRAPSADEYELVIGQGAAFVASCRKCRKAIPRVYLGTGRYAGATAAAVEKCSQNVRRRRGATIHQPHPPDEGPRLATHVLCVGDEGTRASYKPISNIPILEIPNHVVDGVTTTIGNKDFESARYHFLWMAAYGALRRSLDVVLEVIAQFPDCHLWVCGGIEHEKSFFTEYQSELSLPNVHHVGWVDVASPEYAEVTSRCGYTLYPSVSDGMPGSVVNAMAAGVVPIVTDAAGVDSGGFGLKIPMVDHETIRSLILQAVNVAPSRLAEESNDVSKFAWRRYSKHAFQEAFRRHMLEVLESHGRHNSSIRANRGATKSGTTE